MTDKEVEIILRHIGVAHARIENGAPLDVAFGWLVEEIAEYHATGESSEMEK